MTPIQRDLLTKLSTAQKDKGWVHADLSITPSWIIGRLFWIVAQHFDLLRRTFYGVNLAESAKELKEIRAKAISMDEEELVNRAIQAFNRISRSHKVEG